MDADSFSNWRSLLKQLLVFYLNSFKSSSNEFGTPFFTSLLSSLESLSNSYFVGYMNGDLLMHSSFFESLQHIASLQRTNQLSSKVMVMGRRYNFLIQKNQDFSSFNTTQFDSTLLHLTEFSDLFISVAQDFFVFNRGSIDFSLIPDLVIGRNGYDNFMVDFCFAHAIPLIDISQSCIHLKFV